MKPGDGQLSLFEVDIGGQPQSTQADPPPTPAPIDRDDAGQSVRSTRAASKRVPDRGEPRSSQVDGRLLSPEDVARRCSLSRKAVYRAVARGELRAARILSRLRIDSSGVEAWLRANVVDPDRPVPAPAAERLPASTGLRRLLPEP
jgi:excisionase family DNA binding protein